MDHAGLGQTVWSSSFWSCSTVPPSFFAPQSTLQSYLEGVSAGLEQLRSAAQEVQSVCQDLGAARWALLDSTDHFQGLQQMRELMEEHMQLASVVQVLPQIFSGKALAQSWSIWAGKHWGEPQSSCRLCAGLVAKPEQVTQALPVGWMERSLLPQGLIQWHSQSPKPFPSPSP